MLEQPPRKLITTGVALKTKSLRSLVAFIVGVVLFGGLPLLGWGLNATASFFGHPARIAYLCAVVALQAAFAMLYPDLGRHTSQGEKLVLRQRFAVLLLQILSLGMMLAAPYTDRWGFLVIDVPDWVRHIGVVAFILGFVVMNLAEVQLGKQFSIHVTIQKDHRLVTHGLYRHVRHPRYLGVLVYNLGFALLFRSWAGLVITAVLIAVLIWRIHDEEALLAQEFGTEWEKYRRG